MERSSPTVLVARRVVPGREAEFGEWITRVTEAAAQAPGHVAVDVQRPDSTHPDEWLVVYRFVDADALHGWLDSDTRARLIREGGDLIVGEPRMQVIAAVPDDPGVRMVTSYLLKEGGDAVHRAVHDDVMSVLADFPGFREREILDAVEGVQPETVVILTFDDEPSLRMWLDSDPREKLLSRLDPFIEGTYTTSVVAGFVGWFAFNAAEEPKRWKQAVIVFLALFPTVLLITYLRGIFWPDAPLVPAVFVGNVIGIAVLTWVLMPPLTRRLSSWLQR